MYKLTIKTRGKLIQLPNRKLIRTPRILYVEDGEVTGIKSVFKTMRISDYEFEEIDPAKVPTPNPEKPTKMSKIKNDSVDIQIGGKIGGRIGGGAI